MPSKKRKYNARFPAGRIKKIMQTDEEVGKVAQAVPIIISRTLELFVESLLSKALQVTTTRNAKTLSPSHVKQCILAESRFDFLRDLVKNIPDVSAAEEKELLLSAESSPNSSRFSEASVPRRVAREDSSSSNSCDVRAPARDSRRRALSADLDIKPTTATSTITSANDIAIDLTKRSVAEKTVRTANFYQETLIENVQHKSVITVNPTYTYQHVPQPSTSSFATLAPVQRAQVPKIDQTLFFVQARHNNNSVKITPPTPPPTPLTPTPIAPILNIDFSKNLTRPEIKVLDSKVANVIGVTDSKNTQKSLHRQNSKVYKSENYKKDNKSPGPPTLPTVDVDHLYSGNLQIDEDYDT